LVDAQNRTVARGWESKSVEEQMAAADAARDVERLPPLSDAERERERQRLMLSLSRARVLQDLQTTCDRRRRAQLGAALADLDDRLRQLR
jgi:hypothetical protein